MINEERKTLRVLFPRENPAIIGAALTQHFLRNEAKWKVQINEDIGVIKIKSCRSYAFLNSEHLGYWRARKGLSPYSFGTHPRSHSTRTYPVQNATHGLSVLQLFCFIFMFIWDSGREGNWGLFF